MKFKQYLFIRDPLAFAKGNYFDCFTLFETEDLVDGWINAGQIEFEVNVDINAVVSAATKMLDKREAKIREEMQDKLSRVKQARAELLAITYEPTPHR